MRTSFIHSMRTLKNTMKFRAWMLISDHARFGLNGNVGLTLKEIIMSGSRS